MLKDSVLSSPGPRTFQGTREHPVTFWWPMWGQELWNQRINEKWQNCKKCPKSSKYTPAHAQHFQGPARDPRSQDCSSQGSSHLQPGQGHGALSCLPQPSPAIQGARECAMCSGSFRGRPGHVQAMWWPRLPKTVTSHSKLSQGLGSLLCCLGDCKMKP